MHGSINDDNANRKMFVVNTGGFIKNAQYRFVWRGKSYTVKALSSVILSLNTITYLLFKLPDSALMSALNNEILHEEGAVSYDSAPSAEPSDFTRSVNGATIILQKQYNNETIRVRFVEHHFLTYYLHHGVIYCSSIRSSYLE